jgi:glycopeptide antibiotics resistance protein
MELLQLFIPTRFCDVKDMTTGSFGVLVALIVASITERIISLPTPEASADNSS